ncbi:hypothetical protein HJG60_011689 [Phyllostomus discolor]|uniref:Uncharacterized protein n=1 Tax=Phyllostomus discolor TaxID=89673 RepID=A0A833ZW78_9CHIR|nr:hypothetical protein HJG60_011689 [Phyllostomus discolor]
MGFSASDAILGSLSTTWNFIFFPLPVATFSPFRTQPTRRPLKEIFPDQSSSGRLSANVPPKSSQAIFCDKTRTWKGLCLFHWNDSSSGARPGCLTCVFTRGFTKPSLNADHTPGPGVRMNDTIHGGGRSPRWLPTSLGSRCWCLAWFPPT